MLNFKTVSLSFIILILILAPLTYFRHELFFVLALIILIYIFLLVRGSVFVNSGFYIQAYCRGNGTEKSIALSFDDGPDPGTTPLLLDLLKVSGIKAAFFCIGEKAEKYPELLKRIVEEGHILGNHSYSHSAYFDLYSSKKMKKELQKTHKIFEDISGKSPLWFRPPYGVTNPSLRKAVDSMAYKVMGWSIRSLDTKGESVQIIFERIRKKWHPGAIILLHDNLGDVNKLMQMIIDYAHKTEYNIKRPDELPGFTNFN